VENRESYQIATRINANGTTTLKGSFLGKITVGDPGATWVLTVQDTASTPNVKVAIKVTAVGTYHFGWAFGNQGCAIVASGTTPGDVVVMTG